MWVALAFVAGVVIGPELWYVARRAAQTTGDVRFVFGARWKYARTLPRSSLPWLWKWPWEMGRMWCRELVFGNGLEATSITFKDGTVYRKRRFGRAERVQ